MKVKSLQETNPYLRQAQVRNEMTERTVRDSCLMEGLILPPKTERRHRSNGRRSR